MNGPGYLASLNPTQLLHRHQRLPRMVQHRTRSSPSEVTIHRKWKPLRCRRRPEARMERGLRRLGLVLSREEDLHEVAGGEVAEREGCNGDIRVSGSENL